MPALSVPEVTLSHPGIARGRVGAGGARVYPRGMGSIKISLPLLLLALSACGARGCGAEPSQSPLPPSSAEPSPPQPLAGPLPLAAKAARPSAAWWNGAVFYEVFVCSFQDANGDN